MLTNYLSSSSAENSEAEQQALAVLQFADPTPHYKPEISVLTHVELIGENTELSEIWTSDESVTASGNSNNCHWRRTENFQYTSINLELGLQDDYEETTYRGYQSLLTTIFESGHDQLVRFWNYIPHINVGDGDRENYKKFCVGRLRAFDEFDLTEPQYPAASAVGHYREGISISALTTVRQNADTLEHHANPRQVDAFKYPRKYGPSSPSFARATTLQIKDTTLCFVSGTASILGHKSVHRDDLKLQLYTTNDNIRYLLTETGFKRKDIQSLRVYLRNKEDYRACKEIIASLFPDTPIILTHADICRADLLVEIECHCVKSKP